MKKLLYTMLLLPLVIMAQEAQEYMIFENAMLTAHPAKITEFENGLAAHNKKYHAEGVFASRVYWITNGDNSGKYVLATGPLPWSAIDSRTDQTEHAEDFNTNVAPYSMADWNQTYWKFEAALSNFPKDFTLRAMHLNMFDISRFQGKKAMDLMEDIKKVMVEKFPEDAYGIYTNEMPSTKEGRDMVFISFFEKSAWMGEDNEFEKKYDEVHGAGGFAAFLKEWGEVTNGGEQEVWLYRDDLSGNSGEIKVETRQ